MLKFLLKTPLLRPRHGEIPARNMRIRPVSKGGWEKSLKTVRNRNVKKVSTLRPETP